MFDELLVGPRWSFEHLPRDAAVPRRTMLSRFVRTGLKAFVPWRMWRQIRLEHRIDVRRLVMMAIVHFAMLHVACVAMVIGADLAFGGGWRFLNPTLDVLLFPYDDYLFLTCGKGSDIAAPLWAPALIASVSLLMPVSMLLLPISMRRIRVRRAHLLRGFVLALPNLPATMGLFVLLPMLVACNDAMGDPIPVGVLALIMLGSPLLLLVWCALWWRWFLRSYVRMPGATGTVVVLLVLCGIFVFVLAFSIFVWV